MTNKNLLMYLKHKFTQKHHDKKGGKCMKKILTETNHHESGRKIKRDTKPKLVAGDIACRWRC
jgi:hypothetical protein